MQVRAQLGAFAPMLSADAVPALLTPVISDEDRRAVQGDNLEVAMAAVERIADALHKQLGDLSSAGDSRKRHAVNALPDSRKRKKQPQPLADADANAAEPGIAALSAPDDSAYVFSLLNFASALLSGYAQSLALFEWSNGPLLRSMLSGHLLLVDEISLANDAVLERLNPVLEPSRSLLLTEKADNGDAVVQAADGFRVMATMNPGGDYGKKELSPALRNRMTEVWVAGVEARADLLDVVRERMREGAAHEEDVDEWSGRVVDFVMWYNGGQVKKRQLSLRDVLAWVSFIVHMTKRESPVLTLESAYLHGACLVLLDGLAVGSSDSEQHVQDLKERCIQRLLHHVDAPRKSAYLRALFPRSLSSQPSLGEGLSPVVSTDTHFGVAPFVLPRGSLPSCPPHYSFSAPTPHTNLLRVLRALHLPRAVLLEGSPGVGKSSLITALAAVSSHPLVRINLSEQTDMMDLLGVDLPVAGAKAGTFRWCDGAFLQALKRGEWVMLDELNLASQSVLEGLNAVLDHRATVFIPELGEEFHPPPSFRVFACQNPMAQGGGRRGLPASFLNRFTKVQLDVLQQDDLLSIGRLMWRSVEEATLQRMIRFNERVHEDVVARARYGRKGGPWEFNLRDVGRWCELIGTGGRGGPGRWVDLVYLQRMRTSEDRAGMARTYHEVFTDTADALRLQMYPAVSITTTTVRIGDATLTRVTDAPAPVTSAHPLLRAQSATLAHLIACVQMAYPVLLVGGGSSGKSTLVHTLAALAGRELAVLQVNESMDSSDLLGCFEQMDLSRARKELLRAVEECVLWISGALLTEASPTADLLPEKAKKRSRDAPDERGHKKRKGSAAVSPVSPAAESSTALSVDSDRGNIATVSSLHTLLTQCTVQPSAHGDTSSSTSAFAADVHVALTSLLVQLEAVVSAHSLRLPPRLYPSSLSDRLRHLVELSLSPSSVIGTFQWIDGTLLSALEHGHWLLLEDVNFCSVSVLDRLNGLLERGGVLTVNECGLRDGRVRVVTPHPQFRLFGTMNEEYGQLSRAMRNRCVEIVLLDELSQPSTPSTVAAPVVEPAQPDTIQVPSALIDVVQRDLIAMCNALGVAGAVVPAFMVAVHRMVGRPSLSSSSSPPLTPAVTVRHLRQWCALLAQQLHSGAKPSLFQAAVLSFTHAYPTVDVLRDLTLQSSFIAAFNERVLRSTLPSSLLSPTVWPMLPIFPSALVAAGDLEVQRDGALIDFLLRASFCQQLAAVVPASEHDIVALVGRHPELLSSLPGSALQGITQSAALPLTARSSLIASADQVAEQVNTSTLLDVTISGLTRGMGELSPTQRGQVLQPGALVPLFSVSSHAAHPLPSPLSLLRLALRRFVHSSTADDHGARVRHLQRLALHDMLSSRFPTAARELTIASTTLSECPAVPAPPRANLSLLRSLRISRYERCLRDSDAEAAWEVDERPANYLSPLQQSYAHHHGLLRRGRLEYDLFAALYPLLSLTERAVLAACDALERSSVEKPPSLQTLASLHAVVEHRDRLWLGCDHAPASRPSDSVDRKADVEAILIRSRALAKASRALRASLDEVCDAGHVPDVVEAFATLFALFDAVESLESATPARAQGKALLFKHGGHPLLPRSLPLSELLHALCQLSSRVEWTAAGSNDAFWLVDDAWQSALLDALCSVRFITYQSSTAQSSTELDQLLRVLSPLPSKLSGRLDALKAEATQRHSREQFAVQLLSNVDSSLEDLGLDDLPPPEDSGVNGDDGPHPPAQVLLLRTSADVHKLSRSSLGAVLPLADLLSAPEQLRVTALMSAFVYVAFMDQPNASSTGRPAATERSALLGASSMLSSLSRALLDALSSVMSFGSTYTSASPEALVPFQSGQWMVERLQQQLGERVSWPEARSAALLTALPAVLSELGFSAFTFLHRASSHSTRSPPSSAALLTPHVSAFLSRLIADASGVSLMDRHTKRAQISVVIDLLVRQRGRPTQREREQGSGSSAAADVRCEQALLIAQLCWTVLCYRRAFDAAQFAVIEACCHALVRRHALHETDDSPCPSWTSVAAALGGCSDARFAALVAPHIVPAFELILHAVGPLSEAQLARLALHVSLSRLTLLVPVSPFDASRRHLLALSDAHFSFSSLVHSVQFRQWHDSLQHGDVVEDDEWRLLVHRKALTEQRMRRVRQKVTVRRDGARPFADLYGELHRFSSDFVRKAVDLQQRASLSVLAPDEAAMLRRHAGQLDEVTVNFAEHLKLVYGHYPDVIQPIIASLLQAKDALARTVHLALVEQNDETAALLHLLRALLAFPLPSSMASSSSAPLSSLQSLVSLLHPAALDAFDAVCQRAVAVLKERPPSSKSVPVASSANQDGAGDVSHLSASRVLGLLTVLSRAVLLYRQQRTFASASSDSSLYALFDILFSTFVDCWQREREERRKQDEEDAKLYKYEQRHVAPLTEEEQDERTRLELYPDYREDWADIEHPSHTATKDDGDERMKELERTKAAEKRREEASVSPMHLSAENQRSVYAAFTALFSTSASSAHRLQVSEQQMVDAYASGYVAASTLFSALSLCPSPSISSLPAGLDEESAVGHLFMLADTHQRLLTLATADTDAWLDRERMRQQTSTTDDDGDDSVPLTRRQQRKREQREQRKAEIASMPDVWRQPNVEELRRLEPALLALSVRVRAMLNEYPKQEMLVQMLRVVLRLSSMPSTSPVMALLSGTELLLRKAEEWEKYASRELSLQREAMMLRALVVRWRKMELYSWPKALRGVEDKYQLSAIGAFFHLWTVLHVTPSWERGSEEERQYFVALYDSLSAFLRSQCKLGEFETRLDIVRTFAHHMAVAAHTAQSSSTNASLHLRQFHLRLHALLLNVCDFHEQWLPLVAAFIAKTAAPLEKQLMEQVRLARWDLANYEQLRESSDKNHRRLVSVSRRYEEVLAMNVGTVIGQEEERRAQEKTVDLGKVGRELDRVRKQHDLHQAAADKRQRQTVDAAGAVPAQSQMGDAVPLSSALYTAPPPVELYLAEASASSEVSAAVTVQSSSKTRSLLSIFQKTQRLLSSSVLSPEYVALRARSGGAVEGFTVEVIERIRQLQATDANRHRKAKALMDVRKSLEGLGLRYTDDAINKAKAALGPHQLRPSTAAPGGGLREANLTQRIAEELVSVPLLFESEPLGSVFVQSVSSASTVSDTYAVLRVLSEGCDEYVWKVAALLASVKVKVHGHHADLSANEVRKGSGMLEYVTVRIAHLRADIGALGREMQSTGQWIDSMEALTDATLSTVEPRTEPSSEGGSAGGSFWAHKLHLDALVTAVQHYSLLYQRLAGVVEASSLRSQLQEGQVALSALLDTAQRMKDAVDGEMERVHPSVLRSGSAPARAEDLSLLMGPRWQQLILEQRAQLRVQWRTLNASSLPFVSDGAGGLSAVFRSLMAEESSVTVEAPQQEMATQTAQLTDATVASFTEVVRRVQLLVQDAHTAATTVGGDAERGETEPLPLVQELDHHHHILTPRNLHALHRALRAHVHNLALLGQSAPLSSELRAALSAPVQPPAPATADAAAFSAHADVVPRLSALDQQAVVCAALVVPHAAHARLLREGAASRRAGQRTDGRRRGGHRYGRGPRREGRQRPNRERTSARGHARRAEGRRRAEGAEAAAGEDQGGDGGGHGHADGFRGRYVRRVRRRRAGRQRRRRQRQGRGRARPRDGVSAMTATRWWTRRCGRTATRRVNAIAPRRRSRRAKTLLAPTTTSTWWPPTRSRAPRNSASPTRTSRRTTKRRAKDGERKEEAKEDEADVEDTEEEGGVNTNDEDRVEESAVEPFQLPDDVQLDDHDEDGDGEAEGQQDEDEGNDDAEAEELTQEQRDQLEADAKQEEEGGDDTGKQTLEEDPSAQEEVENTEAPLEDVDEHIPPAEATEAEEDRKEEESGEAEPEEQPAARRARR